MHVDVVLGGKKRVIMHQSEDSKFTIVLQFFCLFEKNSQASTKEKRKYNFEKDLLTEHE